MSDDKLSDEEVVYRRIPPNGTWFEPPDRVTSANYKLRRDETGLSVYRAAILAKAEVLGHPDSISGSGLTEATVGEIRRLARVDGSPINLDVVAADEDGTNPGHAEIRVPPDESFSQGVAKRLRELFRLVEMPSEGGQDE